MIIPVRVNINNKYQIFKESVCILKENENGLKNRNKG